MTDVMVNADSPSMLQRAFLPECEAVSRLPEADERAKLRETLMDLAADAESRLQDSIEQRAATTKGLMSDVFDDATFEALVNAHYEALYRFAYSLVHSEADARGLVQDTYVQLAKKGSQLRAKSKAKSWLFTTLYRGFIDAHRRDVRHPKVDLDAAEPDLPVVEPESGWHLDADTVQEAL